MRRLYGDMSFQVTRPNGTKSNAIVEVIKQIVYTSYGTGFVCITWVGLLDSTVFDLLLVLGNIGATFNSLSHIQRPDDRMGNGARVRRKS